jgi:hypothetical protein
MSKVITQLVFSIRCNSRVHIYCKGCSFSENGIKRHHDRKCRKEAEDATKAADASSKIAQGAAKAADGASKSAQAAAEELLNATAQDLPTLFQGSSSIVKVVVNLEAAPMMHL